MKTILIFILTLCFCSMVAAYSAGAPENVCGDMKPQHPGDTARENIPYEIHVDNTSVQGGDEVQITVKGKNGESFKGLLVQARVGEKAVGSFNIPSDHRYIKTINCSGKSNAVTHKNGDIKKMMTFKWIAPKDYKGKVQFFMTMVEEASVFWVKKPSVIVTVN